MPEPTEEELVKDQTSDGDQVIEGIDPNISQDADPHEGD